MPKVNHYDLFSIVKHHSRIISTMQTLRHGYEEVCELMLHNSETFATVKRVSTNFSVELKGGN